MYFGKPRSSCRVYWWVGYLLAFAWHLQVEGRPYEETAGTSNCVPLTLAHPKRDSLSKLVGQLALDKELEGRTLLIVKNDSSFPWKSWRLCEATGFGIFSSDELIKEDDQVHDNDMDSQRIDGAVVVYGSEDTWKYDPAAFIVSQSHMKTLSQFESVVLKVSCSDVLSCYLVSLKQDIGGTDDSKPFRSRRILAYSSQDQHKTSTHDYGVEGIVGVVVGVAGVLLMFFVLFLCAGGGDKYEPSGKTQGNRARTVSGEVAESEGQVAAIQESDLVQNPKTNGTSVAVSISVDASDEPKSQESVEVHSHGSSDHDQRGRRSPSAESPMELSTEAEKRARALSAPRSFDPLPELPKLELAEDAIPERGEGGKRESAAGDDDDEDDDPYDVVPDNNPDRMSNHSHSGSEGGSMSPGRRQGDNSPMPVPYGKVSRHAKPGEHVTVDESDSYAEVRDVMRQGPQVPRERSLTSPVHFDSPGPAARDKRSHTESATHMPLPRIPPSKSQPSVDEDDSVAYDSVRGEGVRNVGVAGKSKPSGATAAPSRRDQLYESVDEMGEKDLYESVPDDLTKLDSPIHLALPDAASFSPAKTPDGAPAPPLPPPSPIPSGEVKKRAIEKTLSSSANEEGRRRFSFFRKKTASVSAVKTKKGESSSSESPALVSTSSPQHKSPPLPNIPVPAPPTDDDDEDTYDKVTPGLPPGDNLFQQAVDDASKSKSLPMGYRTGTRSNLPLPKLPEDSGSGTVVHKRVLEEGAPDEYDTVRHPSVEMIPDEPNYDSVELESRQLAYPQLEIDPPYDKVDKDRLQQELEGASGEQTGFDPPYDKVDQDKLNELREQEALKKESGEGECSGEGETLSLGYSVVRGVTPEGDRGKELEPGPQPEHDEEGYAVVPAEFKMRKRAMSATRDAKKAKDGTSLSPDSVAAGYKVIEHEGEEEAGSLGPRSHTFSSPTKSPAQPVDEQYAVVNVKSKRERKRQELEEMQREQDTLKAQGREDMERSVSPIPPPLPPAPNPEDLINVEVEEPPIPPQMEGINEPEVDDDNGLRIPSDGSDPPYARVRNKVDNPYAVVNNPPYTEIDVSNLTARIQGQGAKVGADEAAAEDEEAGYDVVGAVGIRLKTASSADASSRDKPYDTVADAEQRQQPKTQAALHLPNLNDAESASAEANDQPYDTIADLKEEMASKNRRQQQDLPELATASESNIYDSLLPQSPPKSPTDQPPRSMV